MRKLLARGRRLPRYLEEQWETYAREGNISDVLLNALPENSTRAIEN